MKRLFTVLSVLALAHGLGFAQQPVAVDLPLTLTTNHGEIVNLRFGLDCVASDTIDLALGEAEQPPPPPTDVYSFAAVFTGAPVGKSYGNGLVKDYRGGDVTAGSLSRTYQVYWVPGTSITTVTFGWNLPAGVTGSIKDLFGGVVVNVAMSGSGSTVIPAGLQNVKLEMVYNAPAVPPTAVTGGATEITGTSARLNGVVNAVGQATTFQFSYGTTTSYGSTTTSTSAGQAGCKVDVSFVASGLLPNTLYHYKITATNAGGNAEGLDSTFTTGNAIPPIVTTGSATAITQTTATLNGTVNPNSVATTFYFEYGTTNGYGTKAPIPDGNAGSGSSAAAQNAAISSLTANTLYHYRLVATNGGGTTNGPDSTFTTLAIPKPTVVTGSASAVTQTTATLNGTVNPNGAASTFYFEYGTTNSYGTKAPIPDGNAGSGSSAAAQNAAISSLTANTLYHYRLVATNGGGTTNGPDSTFSTLPVPQAPPTVTTGSASAVTQTTATLNGTVNPNGAATTFYFEYGTTNSYGTKAPIPDGNAGSGSSAAAQNAAISSLSANTLYHYRLVATNSGGTSNGPDSTFTTLAIPKPTVITGSASAVTQTTATLNGTVNPNGTLTSFYFEYGTTNSYGTKAPIPDGTAGSGSSAVAQNAPISSLTANTLYHYRLVATNSGGTTNGPDSTFTTAALPPVAPIAVTGSATAITQTTATLNGTVNPSGFATTYYFEFGTTNSYGTKAPIPDGNAGSGSSAAAQNAAISSLTANTLYHYRLVAINGGGTSEGADSTFTTLPIPPPTVTTGSASAITQTTATLNGTVNPNGSPTTFYFEYGTTPSYGTHAPVPDGNAGSGTSPVAENAPITSLTPNTLYHYRLVATNGASNPTTSLGNRLAASPVGSTTYGPDSTFTTLAIPKPTVTTGSASAVTQTTATLNGTVNPNGAATTFYFEYGTTNSYGTKAPVPDGDAGSGSSAAAQNAPISSLTASTLYHYRLVATNGSGTTNGPDSTFTTLAIPKPTVTTGSASAVTQTTATLNGTVNPNGYLTSYYFEYGTTASYGTKAPVPDGDAGAGTSAAAQNAPISSLTASTLYHYRLVATNIGGTTNGPDSTFTTPAVPPVAPIAVTGSATAITQTTATLNGTVNPSGFATTFYFEYGTTTSYGTKAPVPDGNAGSGSSAAAQNAAISSLTANTLYHYRLVATNGGGTSEGADSTFTTLPITPPTVTTGSATLVTQTTATLNGMVNPNGSPTTFYFEYGTTTSYGTKSPIPDGNAGSGSSAVAKNAAISSLAANTMYHFRLVATNGGGTTNGPDSTFTTPAIAPPTVITGSASAVSQTTATLNGTVNPNGAATTFYFEYGTTTSYGTKAPVPDGNAGSGSSAAAQNAAISSLVANTLYHFRLVATNGGGTTNGPDSTFTTLVVSPVPVSLLVNPGFESGLPPWVFFTNASGFYNNDVPGPSSPHAAHVEVTTVGTNVQLHQTGFPLESGVAYRLTFKAYSSSGHDLAVFLHKHGPDYGSYGLDGTLFDLGTTWSSFSVQFTARNFSGTVTDGRLRFWFAPYSSAGDQYYIDDVVLEKVTPDGKPVAVTTAASLVATTTAQLNGTVNPNGAATTYFFEYGTTTGYGSSTTVQNAGSGSADVPVNAPLTGLSTGQLYHFRVVATNASGTTVGGDMMFTTGIVDGVTTSLLANPGFEAGPPPWVFFTNGTGSYDTDAPGAGSPHAAHVNIVAPGSNMQLHQVGFALEAGATYRLTFKAYSSTGNDLSVFLHRNTSPYTLYGLAESFNLGTSWSTFSAQFVAAGFTGSMTDTRLRFWFTGYAAAGDQYYIDDVVLTKMPADGKPSAITAAASLVTTTSAQMNGSVNPNGSATTYWFEYGPTSAYGSTTAPQNAGSGSADVAVNAPLTPLTPATPYHYRLVAQNASGTSNGADVLFTTGSVDGVTSSLLANPGFEAGTLPWVFFSDGGGTYDADAAGPSSARAAHLLMTAGGSNIQFYQTGFTIESGASYRLTFKAYSSSGHDLQVFLHKHGSPWTSYGILGASFDLGTSWATFTINFVATGFSGSVADARLRFWFAPYAAAGDHYYFDDMILEKVAAKRDMPSDLTAEQLPKEPLLRGNFPNPFNPTTAIEFTLPTSMSMELSIYSPLGQKVRTLVDGVESAGMHRIEWNGADDNGHSVASGIYYYRMRAGEKVDTRRMVLLK